MDDPLALLEPCVASWFRETFDGLTPAQRAAIPALVAGEDLLISSPTGTGKTLAGFLALLSELARLGREGRLEARPYVVYVSPLKALVNDVTKNLQRPLDGIARAARASGGPDPAIRAALRTGDTSRGERAKQLRAPPHILVTTPESLALLLASERWRAHLARVRWVMVDEIHDLVTSKRGAHLALLLERLERNAVAPPVRIGLSATASPLADVAAFLGGGRPVRVAEVRVRGALELAVEIAHPDPVRASAAQVEAALVQRIHAIVREHRTTLVFTNTRNRAEKLALRLGAMLSDADEGDHDAVDVGEGDSRAPVATHHGSMSRDARLAVEDRLKRQDVRCVVATNSLELGIDVEGVDHVVLASSPRSVARTLQRVGRSGHQWGGVPRGTLLVTDPVDLLEAFATQELALARDIEPLRLVHAPLDVLSQHLASVALEGHRDVQEELALVRRAWCYRSLDEATFRSVLSSQPWVGIDGDRFWARRGARMSVLMHGGTIPDAGRVRVLCDGTFVGEVEEGFVEEVEPEDIFRLGGRTWRVARVAGLTLHVEAARGREPTVPEWKGEGMAMTPHLADAVRRRLETPFVTLSHGNTVLGVTQDCLHRWLAIQGRLGLPGPDEVLAETCLTAGGKRALVVHLVAGRRINDALGRALAATVAGGDHRATDLGFAVTGPRSWKPTRATVVRSLGLPIEATLRATLADAEVLKRRFRHVAQRSLLVLRDETLPLGQLQRRCNGLLAHLTTNEPDHPMLAEAWREVLHDAMDTTGAEAWRERLPARLRWLPPSDGPSPLAARILHRSEDADGHEAIRDAELFAGLRPTLGDL